MVQCPKDSNVIYSAFMPASGGLIVYLHWPMPELICIFTVILLVYNMTLNHVNPPYDRLLHIVIGLHLNWTHGLTVIWHVCFLHDRSWILPWIKSISDELDITIHVIALQLSGHCDVISSRLWRHQQNDNRAGETRGRCVKIVVFIVIYGFVMSCKKWNNVYTLVTNCSVLTRVLFGVLFPSLLRNSGNKHQNNPLVSVETVRHSSAYIILYVIYPWHPVFSCSRFSTCDVNDCKLLSPYHSSFRASVKLTEVWPRQNHVYISWICCSLSMQKY